MKKLDNLPSEDEKGFIKDVSNSRKSSIFRENHPCQRIVPVAPFRRPFYFQFLQTGRRSLSI